ncbi:MAG: ATP synthase F0 subunit B [Clostridiales bacterium]|nr:ATP synthase F0 subunit B [Clostridiales bacterium]
MNVDEILDMIDELLEKAVAFPLTGGKSLIDIDKLNELVSEIRLNMPTEIKQAKNLVNDRKVIISDAKAEAETIIRKAEERAKLLISKEEIVRQAQDRATDIIATAQSRAKEIRTATNEYVDGMLGRAEELLTKNLVDVKKTRAALRGGNK